MKISFIASISVFAVLIGASFVLPMPHALAQDAAPGDSMAALLERIGELRRSARYAEAIEAADTLVLVRKADASAEPYEITNAERLRETIALIAGLDRAAQEDLAEADRLSPEIVGLFEAGAYAEAAAAAEKQLDIRMRHLPPENLDVAASKAQLSLQLHRQRYYDRAEPLCREALDARRAALGDEHPDVAGSMYNLASLIAGQGDYREAERLHREVLAMRKRLLGEEHGDIAASLNAVATLLRVMGKYDEAESMLREGLAMSKNLYGDENQFVANFLNNLAIVNHVRGDYAAAEPLYREAIAMYRAVLGDDHPQVTMSLSNLGIMLRAKGDYDNAEIVCREALERERRRLGEKHPIVALNMSNLANVLYAKGDYRGAEELGRQALVMRRKLLGEVHRDVAASAINVGNTLKMQGRYAEAAPLYREALSINRQLLGDEHPEVALNLNNIAALLRAQGDFDAAEPLYREALAMRRRLLGEEDLDVAESLNNLGNLLKVKGDCAAAEPLYREALAIRRRILGDEHWLIAESINNVAVALEGKGDYRAAEQLFAEALAMRRATLGDEHPSVAEGLNNMALIYRAQKDYERAEAAYREALARYRATLGAEHPDVAMCIDGLGAVLADRRDYAGAEAAFAEALAMRRRLLGDEHPQVAETLIHLANARLAQGDYEGAENRLLQAAKVYDAARLRAGAGLARATFLESPYPALTVVELELGKEAEAWPAVEKHLGRVLADLLLTAEERRLTDSEAAREDSLQAVLGDLERELAAYRSAAASDTTGEAEREAQNTRSRLLAAEAEWSAFQRELALKYPVMEGDVYPLARVQEQLNKKSAIIGWLDVGGEEDRYASWAYVIRSSGPVHWACLRSFEDAGEMPPLEESRFLRDGLAAPSFAGLGIRQRTNAMWSKRIAPLSEKLKGVEHLIVIPSGAMLGIPVEALVDNEGVCVGERYSVSYSPSATLYAWLNEASGKRKRGSHNAILLVGDPPFSEAHVVAMTNEPRMEWPDSSAHAAPFDVAMMRSALVGNREAIAALPRLPATRKEVEAISIIAEEPTMLIGEDASEQSLARLAEAGKMGSFAAMHFATHALVDDEYHERSALVLSQVGLPDAVKAAMEGSRIFDGLVTAREIVGDWTLDADLVTLSACETGLGKQVGGEGYIGLSHAFFQAGARSLLVSLWKVEDRATSLLMQRFYENYLGRREGASSGKRAKPMKKAEALREAKLWLKGYAEGSGRKPYVHPYYWSSFILIGRPD